MIISFNFRSLSFLQSPFRTIDFLAQFLIHLKSYVFDYEISIHRWEPANYHLIYIFNITTTNETKVKQNSSILTLILIISSEINNELPVCS